MSRELSKSSIFNYAVEPFQEDFTGRICWRELGNRILAAASLHANSHGFGIKQLFPQGRAWVLSRIAIEMDDMPRVGEQYSIETWIHSIYRTFTDRCFAILRPDGTPFGYAYTIWAMIDTASREAINLEQLPDGGFSKWIDADKLCDVKPFSHIRVSDGAPVRTLNTYYSDIDINNHVNSISYITHLLDLFPKELFEKNPAERIEVAYHDETFAGEQLSFFKEQKDESTCDVIIRKNVGAEPTSKGTVACSCRVTFKK